MAKEGIILSKKFMTVKKMVVLMLLLLLIINSSRLNTVVAAPIVEKITVKIDGAEVSFPDAVPYITEGRTLIPIRVIAEGLGAKVEWKEATKEVVFTKGTDTVILKIGSKTVSINGKSSTLDVPANIKDSRTFVPLRFVSEALGAKVEWIGETRTVLITTTQVVSEKFIEPKFGSIVTSSVTGLVIYNHNDYYKAGGYTIKADNLTYPELNVVKMNAAGTIVNEEYNAEASSSQMNSSKSYLTLNAVHNGTSSNLISPKIKIEDGTEIKFKVTVSNEKDTKVYYPVITMGVKGAL